MDLKARILAESRSLFLRYGVKGVTTDMIASSVGISKRTLYENFENKHTIVGTVVEECKREFALHCEEILRTSGDIIEALFKTLEYTVTTFNKINPSFFEDIRKDRSQLEISIHDSLSVRKLLLSAVDDGIFRDDLNLDLILAFSQDVHNLMHTAAYRQYSRDDILNSLFFTFVCGLCTPKGLQLIDTYCNNLKA